jgi:hypothetical protein
MLDRVRPRFNHATVVAYLALFLALGGVSYGVATGSIDSREIKNNNVRSKDIRDNNLQSRDIRNGTVKSIDVGNGSLMAADFAAGQLPAGAQGPQGPQGAQGAQGPKGDKGDAGPTAASVSAAGTPPPDPQITHASTTITTPVAGRLLVFAHQPQVAASSPAGNVCIFTWALYVDGQPVPGSARTLSASPGQSFVRDWSLFGVSSTVAAGDHTVAVMARSESVPGPGGCAFGSGDQESEPAQVGAVLVGG